MSETYVKVKVVLEYMTRDAALLKFDGKHEWVPRSTIHGGDDLKLARMPRGTTATFRLLDWKAEEIGLG